MQPDLRTGRGDIFDGHTIVGGASEDRQRAISFRADLFAEPIYLHVFERLGGKAVGNFWPGRRTINADDNTVDWICASGMAVFTINRVSGVDGSSAPAILVHCDDVWLEISRRGFFSFEGAVVGGIIYLGDHLHSGRGPNDDSFAADSRKVRYVLSEGEEIFPVALE